MTAYVCRDKSLMFVVDAVIKCEVFVEENSVHGIDVTLLFDGHDAYVRMVFRSIDASLHP